MAIKRRTPEELSMDDKGNLVKVEPEFPIKLDEKELTLIQEIEDLAGECERILGRLGKSRRKFWELFRTKHGIPDAVYLMRVDLKKGVVEKYNG